MATTIDQLLARAEDRRVANGGTSLRPSDASIIVARVNDYCHEILTRLALEARDYLLVRQVVTSSTSSDRYDLETLPRKLSRLTAVYFAIGGFPQTDGTRLNQVQPGDEDVAFAPRFTVRGTMIVEVGSDWAAPFSTVNLAIYGAERAADLTGSVTSIAIPALIPDRFAMLVELRLAQWLAEKDEARDPDEIAKYAALWEAKFAEFVAFAHGITGLPVAAPIAANPSAGKA